MKHRNQKTLRVVGCAFLIIYALVVPSFIPDSYAMPSYSLGSRDQSNPRCENCEEKPGIFESIDPLRLGDVRISEMEGIYVMTNPALPSSLEVVERLPGGGFGRLLRYRGVIENGNWIDLEFIYEDKAQTVTILDYTAGRFYRINFNEGKGNAIDLFPSDNQEVATGDLTAVPLSNSKFLIASEGTIHRFAPAFSGFQSLTYGLTEQALWASRLLRGPPIGGVEL